MMFRDNNGKFKPVLNAGVPAETRVNEDTRVFFSEMTRTQTPVRDKGREADLKLHYRRTLEIAFAIALAALIGSFQIARQVNLSSDRSEALDIKIEVADIPMTQQFKKPPPPVRPSVPIPSEAESIPEDLTIASTEIDLSSIPPPPPPPDEEDAAVIFVAYDEPPRIIGGLASVVKNLEYPRVAKASGLEGTVFVKVLVGIKGDTEKTEIISAKPANRGFEEAAMEALRKVKWIPAKQRDKDIRVWVSMPVRFAMVSS